MLNEKLTKEENTLMGLLLTESLLEYVKSPENEEELTFEEVVKKELFVGQASVNWNSEFLYTLVDLKKSGYIDGEIDIAYEVLFDDEFNETETDDIDFANCELNHIKLTDAGMELLKSANKSFLDKLKDGAKRNLLPFTVSVLENTVANLLSAGILSIM